MFICILSRHYITFILLFYINNVLTQYEQGYHLQLRCKNMKLSFVLGKLTHMGILKIISSVFAENIKNKPNFCTCTVQGEEVRGKWLLGLQAHLRLNWMHFFRVTKSDSAFWCKHTILNSYLVKASRSWHSLLYWSGVNKLNNDIRKEAGPHHSHCEKKSHSQSCIWL